MTNETFRERFLDSNDRFHAAMLEAIRAHQEGVAIFTNALARLDAVDARLAELQENDAELKQLILVQGHELRELRAEVDRLTGER
jgi:hypothetical protein